MMQPLRECPLGEAEPNKRHQRQNGFCATRAVWVPAALRALLLAPLMLPMQFAMAQRSAGITFPVPSAQADEQITLLLAQVETLLNEGHVTSPAGSNATDVFSKALVLSLSASPAGLRTLAEFPSVLKSRADAERTAGDVGLSVRIEAFAEVVSSVIGPRNTPLRADTAPSTQSGSATVAAGTADPAATAGTADPKARKAAAETTQASATPPGPGAGDQAALPVSEEAPRRTVGASPSKTITDTRSSLSAFSIPTAPVAQHVPPPARQAAPPASPGERPNADTANGSGRSQVATLTPATAPPAASSDGIAAKPSPAKSPLMPAAMVDELIKQGNAMLLIGDISAARLLFARAAESGNGEAALMLGDTYNPVFLAQHGVVGPLADLELAKGWYRKAFAFGEPRARERLSGLGGDTHAEAQGPMSTQ